MSFLTGLGYDKSFNPDNLRSLVIRLAMIGQLL
jgi:hypothetical protein